MRVIVNAVWLGLLVGLASIFWRAGESLGQNPTPNGERAFNEVELRTHLRSLSARIEDVGIEVIIRERLAMEVAATLDRAAQAAETPDKRRSLWREAIEGLDRFREANHGHGLSRAFEVQAAVYLWARARMEMSILRMDPSDPGARTRAVDDLQAAVERLRKVGFGEGTTEDIYAKNARFRLAQALADLAEVSTDDANTREVRNNEALDALGLPLNEPTLQGYQLVLKGTLLTRLNRLAEAEAALDAAAKLKPPVSALDLLDARIALLSAGRKYDEAMKLIDSTTMIDAAVKPSLKAATLLSRWRTAVDPLNAARSKENDRAAVETALFHELKALRKGKRPELRPLLVDVLKTIKQAGPEQDPEAWDLLAEGAVVSKDLVKAGDLERKAAERAKMLGLKPVEAEDRLKAGAYYYQAGRHADVEALLGPLAADAGAGAARVKASLLLALSRGRALSANVPGVTKGQYAAALKNHLQLFPNDPTATEVRWLLGKVEMADGNRASALKLWNAIPHGQPRWLDTRLEIARMLHRDLDYQRLNGDRDATEQRFKAARDFLENALKTANGDAEINPLRIELARLELTPNIGHPAEAQKELDAVLKAIVTADQRTTARWLRLVAVAQLSRFAEAEQFVKRETRDALPEDLLEPVRLLDRTAAESESDLRARRTSFLTNVILERLRLLQDLFSPEVIAELSLRGARALAFSGDTNGAKRMLANGKPIPRDSDPDLLRDLAEVYERIEAYGLAEDVQRLRAKQLTPGTLPWLDARYSLALAYYHEGKPKEALQLIDSTSILHPELGGGELKNKFIRLRQRLQPTPSTGSGSR